MPELEKVIYMLRDDDGHVLGGPYHGVPGLDIEALASGFRAMSYAKAEAAGDDFCMIGGDDLATWLIERGLLTPIETVDLTASVDTRGEHAYVPAHWPQCPSCDTGRGETWMGRVLHSLNRTDWHRKCTSCGHTWDHRDEAYDASSPMLDDDGRCIDSGCVPYAISQAGGVPFERALNVCRAHGWRADNGIDEHRGIEAAIACGLEMREWKEQRVAGTLTLRRLFDRLSPAGNYVVATRGHWLAVVKGENRDQADTHLRSEVLACWEVRRSSVIDLPA